MKLYYRLNDTYMETKRTVIMKEKSHCNTIALVAMRILESPGGILSKDTVILINTSDQQLVLKIQLVRDQCTGPGRRNELSRAGALCCIVLQ